MAEKERNKFIFDLWSALILIMNFVFTLCGCPVLFHFVENEAFRTPLAYIFLVRFAIVMVFWIMICNDYDFSTKPRKLSTLEKAKRVINQGEYKKQLKEDKEELKRRKGISRELKYIEKAIVLDAKNGSRETEYYLPVDYCIKDVELYLQNHGFKAEIDYHKRVINSALWYCHPLYIEW